MSSINPAVQAVLAEYRGLLVKHFGERIVEVSLFGSYARDDARQDSDVDVLVVLDRIACHAERMLPTEIAGDLTVKYGLLIAPIVLSAGELELLHQREDLLATNLDREGIAI
ncbi:MAG TPA: nucleotidyltransferase domain-containing protein [Polyangiaceae bacterium]